uniref:Uncharacterized protein n=1 Tax=Oryza glumipatula TaxID=40148 RepID=A0A0E0B938_9ORYZ
MLEVDEEDSEQLMMTSCQCANGDEDDRGNAVTRRGNTGAARCRCSSENSTGGEATLRRAPLSVPTTCRGGPRAATLQPERATQQQPKA